LAGNEITGIPTGSDNFAVTITVTDATAGMSGTISFMWAVSPPPSVSPPSNTTTAPGGTVSGQAVGTAGAPPYTFALLNAPDWLQIDPSTGVLSGTACDDVADYPDIVIQLTDARGAVATSAPFTWSVYQVPTLVPPGDQTSDLNAIINLQLQATCAVEPCVFSEENLPSWVGLDASTGLISGTAPDSGGLFTDITVSITDGRGTSLSSKFAWVVGPKQTISTPDDQVWTVGRALQSATSTGLQIAAECSAAPCTYGLAAGSGPLPTGLTLNTSTGLITGTPTTTGTWTNIIVSVTNAVGVPAAASPISWTINPQPTLTQPTNQRTVAGGSVSLQLGYTCQSQPCAFTSTSLPAGLSLGDDGKISGSATTGGKSTVTVNVTDKSGATASRSFTWYVLQMTTMPDLQLTQQGNSGKCNGTNLTQTLTNYLIGYSDTTSINFSADRTDLVRVTGTRLDVITTCKTSINATVTITARDIGGSAPAATVSTTFRLRITS
jgi:hypothetical protein